MPTKTELKAATGPARGLARLAKRIQRARGDSGWMAFAKRLGANSNTIYRLCEHGRRPTRGTVLLIEAQLAALEAKS